MKREGVRCSVKGEGKRKREYIIVHVSLHFSL